MEDLKQGVLQSSEMPTYQGVPELPVTLMKQITNDFFAERELGKSVFGTVYKVRVDPLTFKHQILPYETVILMIHGGG